MTAALTRIPRSGPDGIGRSTSTALGSGAARSTIRTATARYGNDIRENFGEGAPHVESALANASRILPIITTAHGTSAGNNTYWPEIYLNQSMFDAEHWQPYNDTPSPRVFGNVSPLDPQLFSRINDFADSILNDQ